MSESESASSSLWPSVMTVALTSGTFLAGMLVGHKLGRPMRRLIAVGNVGQSKMALVVQGDLKMGRGKLAAQCSHGAVAAYRQAERRYPELLDAWEGTGQAKVVLKVDTEEDMKNLEKEALKEGVPVVSIRDAGRTQIPSGSLTVVAVGPASLDDVDKVTGHLKLL